MAPPHPLRASFLSFLPLEGGGYPERVFYDEQFYFDALRHSERSGDRALCRGSPAPVYTTAPCLSTLLVYRADYGFFCDPGLRVNGYRTAYE